MPCMFSGRDVARAGPAAHRKAKAVAAERWAPCSQKIKTPVEQKSQPRPKPPQRTPHRMHFHKGTYHDCEHTAMLARIQKCALYCMDVLYKLYVAEAAVAETAWLGWGCGLLSQCLAMWRCTHECACQRWWPSPSEALRMASTT